jgi:hypothetical protein
MLGSRISSKVMSSPTSQFSTNSTPPSSSCFVAAHHHVLLQLEAGDAVGHQPAGAVIAVIDRHLQPARRSMSAAASPPGPAPMMPTLLGALVRGRIG